MSIAAKSILLTDGNKKERLSIAVMINRFSRKVWLVTYGEEARDCL